VSDIASSIRNTRMQDTVALCTAWVVHAIHSAHARLKARDAVINRYISAYIAIHVTACVPMTSSITLPAGRAATGRTSTYRISSLQLIICETAILNLPNDQPTARDSIIEGTSRAEAFCNGQSS